MVASSDDENGDKPLDPAVERVRRKLVRFIVINLSLLFAAVIIVIAAIVYRSASKDMPPADTSDLRVPAGEAVDASVPVPPGARVLAHTLAGNRVSLDLELLDGQRMILVYDFAERRVVARLAVTPQ